MASPPPLPNSLSECLIPSAPPSTYYIPNFLSPSEQAHLLQKVFPLRPPLPLHKRLNTDPYKQINSVPLPTWRHLSHRRLQAHPSPLTNSNTLLAAPLPQWLQDPIIPRILSIPVTSTSSADDNGNDKKDSKNIFSISPHKAPNHVLINEYIPGQGIHPHEDGGAYYPVVATISLAAPIVLDVYPKPGSTSSGPEHHTSSTPDYPLANLNDNAENETKPAYRIFQEPGSLLVSTGEMYMEYLHGIAGVDVDECLRGVDEEGGEGGGIVNWEMVSAEWRERVAAEGDRWRRTQTRTSVTLRDVARVKKMGFLLGAKK
ncbi:MAG: hypothetical protein Q9168_005850 [Polycauliona sp. 1 TL-2023]